MIVDSCRESHRVCQSTSSFFFFFLSPAHSICRPDDDECGYLNGLDGRHTSTPPDSLHLRSSFPSCSFPRSLLLRGPSLSCHPFSTLLGYPSSSFCRPSSSDYFYFHPANLSNLPRPLRSLLNLEKPQTTSWLSSLESSIDSFPCTIDFVSYSFRLLASFSPSEFLTSEREASPHRRET